MLVFDFGGILVFLTTLCQLGQLEAPLVEVAAASKQNMSKKNQIGQFTLHYKVIVPTYIGQCVQCYVLIVAF